MLNRHAIVLFLALAAAYLLRGGDAGVSGALGPAFVCLVAGLFLDDGQDGPRAALAHVLQAAGVALLAVHGVQLLLAGDVHLGLVELGIGLTSLGVLLELRLPYPQLRVAIAIQLAGDLVVLSGLAVAALLRGEGGGTLRWVFVALSGAIGLYALVTNVALQLARLRNPQAGWRYVVQAETDEGLALRTPDGVVQVAWRDVRRLVRLDSRRLLLVLPSPLPAGLDPAALPVEELREEAAPVAPETAPPPSSYALILHEQEIGRAADDAEAAWGPRVR